MKGINIIQKKEFNKKEVPFFMTINWSLVEKGQSLFISNDDLLDKRNIDFIVKDAKKNNVDLDLCYKSDGVIFIVARTYLDKNKQYALSMRDAINEIKEAFIKVDSITWTQIQKTPPFTKYKIREIKQILNMLKEENIIYSSEHQPEGGGRPTTKWSLVINEE